MLDIYLYIESLLYALLKVLVFSDNLICNLSLTQSNYSLLFPYKFANVIHHNLCYS